MNEWKTFVKVSVIFSLKKTNWDTVYSLRCKEVTMLCWLVLGLVEWAKIS